MAKRMARWFWRLKNLTFATVYAMFGNAHHRWAFFCGMGGAGRRIRGHSVDMDRTQVIFTGSMLTLLLAMWAWMAVGAWPVSWVEWRAEHGDQRAVGYLLDQAYKANDAEAAGKWHDFQDDVTERDILFMEPESRNIMRKLWEAQGKPTPLLDKIND